MSQAAQPQPDRYPIPRSIAMALGIIGDSSPYRDALSLNRGPLLDPYFQLSPPVSDRLEGWRITGLGMGSRCYNTREEAREVFQKTTGTLVSLRDAMKAFGSVRLDNADMNGHDHLFHFWVQEKVVQHFLERGGGSFSGAAFAIQHWLESNSAGTQFDLPVTSWAAEQELGMRSAARVPRDATVVRESPFFAAMQRLCTARCIYVDAYLLAARDAGLTTDLGLSYSPGITYPDSRTPGKTRPVKMSSQVLGYAWGRAMAYHGGMPRIPVEVLAHLGRRPGALRILTTWVSRCGLRHPDITYTIPNTQLAEILGYDVASLKKLRQLISENLDRLALILKIDSPYRLPQLDSTGLVLPGVRGAALAPAQESNVGILAPAISAEDGANLRHRGTEGKPPTPKYQTSDIEVPNLRHRGAKTSDTEVPEPPTSRYPSYTSLFYTLTPYLKAVAEGQSVPSFEAFFGEGGDFVNLVSESLGMRLHGEMSTQSVPMKQLPFPSDTSKVNQSAQVIALCHAAFARRPNLAPWGRHGYGMPTDRSILNKPPLREAMGFVMEEPTRVPQNLPNVIMSYLKASQTGLAGAAAVLQEPQHLNTAVQDWITAAALLFATEESYRSEIHTAAVALYRTVLKPFGWLGRTGSEHELSNEFRAWMGMLCAKHPTGAQASEEGPSND